MNVFVCMQVQNEVRSFNFSIENISRQLLFKASIWLQKRCLFKALNLAFSHYFSRVSKAGIIKFKLKSKIKSKYLKSLCYPGAYYSRAALI